MVLTLELCWRWKNHNFVLRLLELGCCYCEGWSEFTSGVRFRWRFFFLDGWVGAVSILGEVNRLQRITRLICRDVAYHGTKIWILWCWVLINWAVELKNWFFVMVVIYGMFFTGVPFLVAFVGAIVIGFIRRSSFCWFRVFSMWFACYLLGVCLFLLFSRDCFPGGWLWNLYDRFIAVFGCRWSFSSTYLLESWGAVWVICAFVVEGLWIKHFDGVIIVFISSGWWIGFSKWGQCWQRVLVGISFVWLFGL